MMINKAFGGGDNMNGTRILYRHVSAPKDHNGKTIDDISPEGETEAGILKAKLDETAIDGTVVALCSPIVRTRKLASLLTEGRRQHLDGVEEVEALGYTEREGHPRKKYDNDIAQLARSMDCVFDEGYLAQISPASQNVIGATHFPNIYAGIITRADVNDEHQRQKLWDYMLGLKGLHVEQRESGLAICHINGESVDQCGEILRDGRYRIGEITR